MRIIAYEKMAEGKGPKHPRLLRKWKWSMKRREHHLSFILRRVPEKETAAEPSHRWDIGRLHFLAYV